MKTLLMIKPDVVRRGQFGEIISIILRNKFKINKLTIIDFTREQAEKFYDVHRGKPFYAGLVEYMTSGPVVAMEVSDDGDTVSRLRGLMGPTDPADAQPGTIRWMYGTDIQHNAVHGSDSQENAEKELEIVFGGF